MNIKQAKQEVVDTVRSVSSERRVWRICDTERSSEAGASPWCTGNRKDADHGAGGAVNVGVALVAYTITHHTRQSAIGLPFISKKEYGGREYSATEYTMSEIVASIYDRMRENRS